MLISDNESKAVWDKVYKTLHFQPNVNRGVIPFVIAQPYVIYDISTLDDDNINAMDEVITRIFIECTNESEYLYALNWQHCDFKFHPRNDEERKSIYVADERYMGGGYSAYFPSYYPDGDYYFFIAFDFRFGYLGHPWQQKIWIFGDDLIKAFKRDANKIGFVFVEKSDK